MVKFGNFLYKYPYQIAVTYILFVAMIILLSLGINTPDEAHRTDKIEQVQ